MHPIVEKPVFVGWLALIVQLPVQIFMSVWTAGFLGIVAKSLGFTHPGLNLVLGIIAFLTIPCVTILGKQMSYARTTYSFFQDHVEVVEGFLTRQMKSVAYTDIREVTLRRGALQRLCGLGSVYLGTLATGSGSHFNPFSVFGFESVTTSGVTVRDLSDSETAYATIRKCIDDAKATARQQQHHV